MVSAVYIEADCTFEHQGRKFESSGAYVSEDHAIGYVSAIREYPGAPAAITNWHGDLTLGHGAITAVWKTPNSWISGHMMQIRVKIDGRWFTGRSAGNGMLWKGRRERGRK